ncbi:MAG: hypothetical protein LH606_12120 [Cytophagaceae bacterium]|nr:hypothetical protein [Cytophagaceae bacterium]
METAYKIILFIHIVFGFTALVTGLGAIIARKGSPWHTRVGLIYFWSMFGVFMTTIGLFGLRPTEARLHFFLAVAVASFYQTFTGRRALGRKKLTSQPARLDWIALGLVVGFGVMALGYAGWMGLQGNWFMVGLFVFFAWACLGSGFSDWKLFNGRTAPERGHWLFMHIARMMGSYAATTTAFLVNMSGRMGHLPPAVQLIIWVAPGALIGGLGISYWKKKYSRKMASVPNGVSV